MLDFAKHYLCINWDDCVHFVLYPINMYIILFNFLKTFYWVAQW